MDKIIQKVWFITGASKGLGLALAIQLLEQGQKVAATSRSIQDLKNAIGTENDNFLPLSVDIRNEESVSAAIEQVVARFGKVDVIVNNAGYGVAGALEELTDAESRQNFDVNVFGSLNVIRKAMPYLRKQGSGHIFNIASIGGFTGAFPGFGIYCATKFAVHGFSESLREEVKNFGVKVTVVSPGYFRTSFLSDSSLNVPSNQMQEYAEVRAVQAAHEQEINGNQPGDPKKAAAAFISVADMENPPVHLFLGEDAYEFANTKIASVQKEMEQLADIGKATGFE
ncbi:SDR family oxidoreductase [Pedobacter panaciterrae]|uniref:SDR family oxidoreductase n=1 Tax=Pedobacter panaciterrae TaxID=363849 RepID=UPI0025945CF8|nr:SDR family oxidoreductase [uncultured Pedobacter sp.]